MSTTRFISVLALVAAGCGCASNGTEDALASAPLVACTADKLPTDGAKCDPATYGPDAYCRLQDCSTQCLDECACVAGRWKCGSSCRDNYGCGTPPLCRSQPCSADAGG